MVALLLVVSVVSLGNVAGQQYTYSQQIMRPQSTPSTDSQRSISQDLQHPPTRRRYSVETINQHITRTTVTFDIPEQNIARDPEPQRRVTTRNKNGTNCSSRTDQNRREGSKLSEKHSGDIDIIQNCSLVYDNVDFEDALNSKFNRHSNLNASTDSDNVGNDKNSRKEINPPALELLPPLQNLPETTDKALVPGAANAGKLNTTGVTVGSRDSFNGDKCATGYIRVNDTCVPVD